MSKSEYLWLRNAILWVSVLQPFKTWQINTGFRQESVQSSGNAWHVFIQRWAIHTCCHPCLTPPTPLWTKCTQSHQGANITYNKAWFCTCGPILKAMGVLLIGPGKGIWQTPFLLQYFCPPFHAVLYLHQLAQNSILLNHPSFIHADCSKSCLKVSANKPFW